MDYAEARRRIRSGDLIALRQRGGLFAALTRWITRSPYTHTAVAVWSGNAGRHRLLVAEAKGSGCFFTPLSQYAEVDFDVFIPPFSVLSTRQIEDIAWSVLGEPHGYDLVDLLWIAANRLFGWPLPAVDDDLLICSALSAHLWLEAGWRPVFLPAIPAPDDVVAAVGTPPTWKVRKSQ